MSLESELLRAAEGACKQLSLSLVRELGRGAFKFAYLAKGEAGEVALKLSPMVGPVDRLVREVEALRGCSHPNVAQLIDAFPANYGGQDVWVVQEQFLPGGTLEARLAAGPVPVDQVRWLGIGLGSAIEHLDERRLVHRDIKPANILFAEDGVTPVLTDFGIVRVLDLPSITRDFMGLGPGTPAYAAPEQLNNEKALIDWRTDQFDLAVVLAECVLGRHPFMRDGQSIQQAIVDVASKNPMPIPSQKRLEELGLGCLVRALSPWPVARFRRPRDFIESLGG